MDPISHSTADISPSVENASIALSPIATNCPSPRPSALKYSEDLGLTNASVTNSTGRESLGCDIHMTPEMKSKTLKSREYIQFITLCWFIYLEGWNDGTNGPLLPRIQRVYGVRLSQPIGR